MALHRATTMRDAYLWAASVGRNPWIESGGGFKRARPREAQGIVLSDYMYGRLHDQSAEVDLEYYENPKYHDTLHLAQQ